MDQVWRQKRVCSFFLFGPNLALGDVGGAARVDDERGGAVQWRHLGAGAGNQHLTGVRHPARERRTFRK